MKPQGKEPSEEVTQRLEREAEGGGSEWGEGQAEEVGGRMETEWQREAQD